jgi:chorismate mutase
MGAMMDFQERLVKEREEIAKRVASFRATQEKFKREREEYCVTTLQTAVEDQRGGSLRLPLFWS